MLCIRVTSHGPVSVCLSVYVCLSRTRQISKITCVLLLETAVIVVMLTDTLT